MQLLKSSSGMTIEFYPNQHAPRVGWQLGNAYALYSHPDKQVVSANACYSIIARITGIDISEVDGYLGSHYHKKQNNWTDLYRHNHDVFFEQQADHALARFANIRAVEIHICADCNQSDQLKHDWIAESNMRDGKYLCGSCATHIEPDTTQLTRYQYPHTGTRFAFVPADARPIEECDGRPNETIYKYPLINLEEIEICDRYAHIINHPNPPYNPSPKPCHAGRDAAAK